MNLSSVSNILKEGMVVSTKIAPSNTWYQNIIYKCEGDIVYTSLLHSYLANIIMPGNHMVIKYTNEYFEYILEGLVSEIHPDFPGYITIKITKAEELVNTRTFPRFDIYLPANLKRTSEEAPYFSIITNISLIGVALISKYSFVYGEEYDMTVYFPANKIATAKGKIIRKIEKRTFVDYGLHFTEMLEENNNLLSNYFTTLEEEKNRLQSHFHNNIKPYFFK